MIERRIAFIFVALIGVICTGGAKGDVTAVPADPPISSAAQSALNLSGFSAELAKVGPEVTKLVQNPGDPGIVSMVRQWLINQDPTTATNPYQSAYTTALNTAFVSALSQPNVPINSKLNMGIVIASLSGPKTNLSDTILKLLQDGNTMVALQGLKAAGAMLPLSLQDPNFNNGPRGPLLDAIVAVVTKNSEGPLAGQIAQEAYRAINPSLWTGGAPSGAAFTALVDSNLKLQNARNQIYATVGVPANPKADTYASYLMLSKTTWPLLSDAEKLQAVQQASDLVSLLGQRYSGSAQNLQTNRDLIDALKSQGRWIAVLGDIVSDPAISSAGNAVQSASPEMPATTIQQVCSQVYPALSADSNFNTLKAPPVISAGAAPANSLPAANQPGGASPKSASDNSSGSTSPTSSIQP